MKKNIWFIMVGAIVVVFLVIIIIRVIITLLNENGSGDMPIATSRPSATVPPSVAPVSTRVEEEPTPTLSQLPTATSVPSTDAPVPPTDTPTATPTPTDTPTLSPSDARSQLEPFDQQMQEFDRWVGQTPPERLQRSQCPYIRNASGECWRYAIGMGNVILIKGYFSSLFRVDIYAYDFDDEQPEILKWDLDRDGEFDVIEYDVDGDSVFDLARADVNTNGQFDEDEIYMYQSTVRRWRPLVPGTLPFPPIPIFPY